MEQKNVQIEDTKLSGVKILTPARFGDERGFFSESWNRQRMEAHGIDLDFVQDNHSMSAEVGTIRGLHFQAPPHAQDKLVRCGQGALFDVAVDVRVGSPTYGDWVGVELTAENGRQMLVPKGFLHGFITRAPMTEIIYKCTDYYAPECDGAVRWDSCGKGHSRTGAGRFQKPLSHLIPMPKLTASQAHRAYLERTRFGALDGLRALAILAVLIHHSALAQEGGAWSRGFLGVDLFFVISGFLITTLLLRERDRAGAISLRGFYWRRALRILPLYYLVVTLAGIYFVIGRGHLEALQIWPAYYLFFANFLTEHIPTLYPTWSLSMEEQFYLIWPLVMIWLPPRYWGGCAGWGGAQCGGSDRDAGRFGHYSVSAGPALGASA